MSTPYFEDKGLRPLLRSCAPMTILPFQRKGTKGVVKLVKAMNPENTIRKISCAVLTIFLFKKICDHSIQKGRELVLGVVMFKSGNPSYANSNRFDGFPTREHATYSCPFDDEAHFWLNGYVNKQNCRIWSEANPQVYVETPLHPEKLTVWCALWAGGILLQKR
ncbi:hypothetical protein TNCV_3833261 [Trichonephila clavipes]|nr:hypothetical protein TNCV_3833261 [Trichonephila clavipes]